jgi:hypothetical protein
VFAEDFGAWDYVVNLASETKYSQAEQVGCSLFFFFLFCLCLLFCFAGGMCVEIVSTMMRCGIVDMHRMFVFDKRIACASVVSATTSAGIGASLLCVARQYAQTKKKKNARDRDAAPLDDAC